MKEAEPSAVGYKIHRMQPIIFPQNRRQRDLRDDILILFVLKNWFRREIEGEDEVSMELGFDFRGFFETQTVGGIGFGGDGLRFHF